MADIKSTVNGPASQVQDIAMVQLMLKVTKDAKGHPYLGVNYSGVWNNDTKDAIVRFQKDHQLIAPPPPPAGAKGAVPPAGAPAAAKNYDNAGEIALKSATWQKLVGRLPAAYADVMIYPGTKTCYLPGAAADAKASAGRIQNDPQLDIAFATKAADFVTQFFKETKIVLKVAGGNLRRDFQKQMTVVSQAGPGESNHQWGRAGDIGYDGLRWIEGDGTIHADNSYLDTKVNKKVAMAEAKRMEFWKLHKTVYTKVGLNPTGMPNDFTHVQAWKDGQVSMSRSLAKLLTATGAMKWEAQPWKGKGHPNEYKVDFGLGGQKFVVGTAKQLFGGHAVINLADVAAALQASKADLFKHAVFKDFQFVKTELKAQKLGPGKQPAPFTGAKVKVTDITQADLQLLVKAAKADWVKADQGWKQWVPVP